MMLPLDVTGDLGMLMTIIVFLIIGILGLRAEMNKDKDE